MNVYDFDGTIYSGDSSLDFYLFCLRCHPGIIRFLPRQTLGVLAYKFRLISKKRGKELFFSFLRGIKNPEPLVRAFWSFHAGMIQPWYLRQREDADVVISASPEFLLEPICRKLNVCLIASVVDIRTGSFAGENCYGEEKVRRFLAAYPKGEIGSFYSDSYSDAPMAALACMSYIVRKGKKDVWNSMC